MMKVQEVLSQLAPVVGLTSLIGAPGSVMSGGASGVPTLEAAEGRLDGVVQAQAAARSDAAYWGYAGQVAYWRAVVSILQAAEITGPDSLPDLPVPDLSGRVVMDACWEMEQYGKRLLDAAKAGK